MNFSAASVTRSDSSVNAGVATVAPAGIVTVPVAAVKSEPPVAVLLAVENVAVTGQGTGFESVTLARSLRTPLLPSTSRALPIDIVGRPLIVQPLSEKIPSVIGPGAWMTSFAPMAGVMSELALPAG